MCRLKYGFFFTLVSLGLVSSGLAEELIRKGDFSETTRSAFFGKTTSASAVDGAWVTSVKSPWSVLEFGGNLGAYIHVESKNESASRLLYVIHDKRKAVGNLMLSFDYYRTHANDELGVIVFGVNKELSIGGDSGAIQMEKGVAPGMTFVEISKRWKQHNLPVNLGDGFEYVYVLFAGRAQYGQIALDNVFFQPNR